MKQVWKCDFCHHTGTHVDVEKHETDCSFKPANRECWTCKHRTEEGAPISGFSNGCELKVPNRMEIEDGGVQCVLWCGKK